MSDCPYCRQPGAERLLWKVRCPNAACPKYDSSMSQGTLARTTGPKAGVLGRTGPIAGVPEAGMGKPFNWGLMFGGLLMALGLASLMGLFRSYIGSRGFMWGLALLYLGWKTVQGSNASAPPAGEAGEKGGDDAVDAGGENLDSGKTARILCRSEEGLVEYAVLRRSVTVNGEEVTAMDSASGNWETFSAEKIANLEDVKQVARDNGQNYG